MSNAVKTMLGVALLLVVAAGGYWYGNSSAEFRVPSAEGKAERKPLYYRNPMGLPDTSPVPKKDSMGMDYVPVYEGEAESGSQLSISVDKVQKLGVKSEAAALRELNRTLRVTGRIEIDERRLHTIAPRFGGWVEHLYVNTTGQAVTKGQALFDVYSPELVSAQREHALAQQGLAALKDADDDAKQSMRQLADASAERLKNWDMADTPISELPSPQSSPSGRGGERESQSSIPARPRVTFRAPANGIVLEKKAVQGMRFMPGEMLYQIADLSSVWVIAEVPEQDIGQIELGSPTQVTVDAWPERSFDGKVAFIYPTLNSATRTVQVRIEIANPKALLKPAMFANAQIGAGKAEKVVTVPTSAVIDSGTRQTVLVRLAEGRFEPRAVTLGSRSDDYVEVLSGIVAGEEVVTSANFLLDSESNLKAALGGMGEAPVGASLLANGNRQQAGSYKAGSVGHQAQGTLEAINDDSTVSITHDPIPALKWPSMTMDFALANPSLAANIKPGSAISFEIVERGEGEWVITKLQAQHEGH
ncbi:MAG: efflux RND transporter periplasmic adaptor subunit [Gammaproteobacteria bacterium]|nr:efflux RND transporter periplasmic adaptor subunit [Gammaproteobacteria bacterium]MBU1777845.1 efflux RND transporter periplasmic adaptor subunit [Gammaproteobacteria bacterium]MBU1969293.1 efflux RND transporter periplasmic adaptor subunit [Gammaproteobacteria bacterium]